MPIECAQQEAEPGSCTEQQPRFFVNIAVDVIPGSAYPRIGTLLDPFHAGTQLMQAGTHVIALLARALGHVLEQALDIGGNTAQILAQFLGVSVFMTGFLRLAPGDMPVVPVDARAGSGCRDLTQIKRR